MAKLTKVEDAERGGIVVWRSGALGDTLLGFPALAELRSISNESTITAIGRPEYLALARDAGLVDRIVDSDSAFATRLFLGDPQLSLTEDLAVVWSSAHAKVADRLRVAGVPNVIHRLPRAS